MPSDKFYQVNWTILAEESYSKELEFIYLKWNTKEVIKFMTLVNNIVDKLQSGIIDGHISKKNKFKTTRFVKTNHLIL